MKGHRIIAFSVFTVMVILCAPTDATASESCSESVECIPDVVCQQRTCNCDEATLNMNATCSECNMTSLMSEPCCCDFMPYCIMKQRAEPQLLIRSIAIDDVNGYQQTKAEVFLLKDTRYVRVSTVIFAAEDCEAVGGFQAIQIIQSDEACQENITSSQWPTYSDWELDGTTHNSIYPEELSATDSSCYGDTTWSCTEGLCAYTSSEDPITRYNPSDHYDWCGDTAWLGCEISSSSNLTGSYAAEFGKFRLFEPALDGGWAPDLYDTQPFIQILFNEFRTIIGIVTQGMAANFNRRIDAFQIAYMSGDEEFFIMMGDKRKTFNSSVRFHSETVSLFEPVVTTVVKLLVTEPESLYLIGGRFSAIEAADSAARNSDIWKTLQSDSPTWSFAANELLSPSSPNKSNDWELSSQNDFQPLDIPTLIDERVLDLGDDLKPGENISIIRDTFVLEIQRSTTRELCMNDLSVDTERNQYSFPKKFFCKQQSSNSDADQNITIGVTTYSTLGDIFNQFQIGSSEDDVVVFEEDVIVTDIISAVVYFDSSQESVPFRFTLSFTKDDIDEYRFPSCKFWDVESKRWSSYGCNMENSSLTGITCFCNHTTSFSILMSLSKEPQKYDLASDILTYAGLGLSVASLVISLIIFFVLRHSMTADRVVVHVNLMIAILLADVTFLAGIDRTSNPPICKAVAFLLHFFYEAVICWMLVEGVHLYRQIIRVFESERPRTWIYFLVGWGIPAVIVGIAGGLKHASYGVGNACWLSTMDNTIWFFIGPAIPIMMINLVILILVVKTVITASKKQNEVGQIDLIKAGVRSSFLLLPLLGIPWLLGPFVHFNYALTYIFDFLNTLQGLFISLFYCFLNSEVRRTIQSSMRKTRDSQNASFTNSSDNTKKTHSSVTIRKVRVSPAPPSCDKSTAEK
nr:adhesion G protein-coupled receptor L3-like [Lytechinus pictus]